MTLIDLIPAPQFQGTPRFIRGSCSAKEKDSDERVEDEIQARDERTAAMRKSRELRRIDGFAGRVYRRERRREKIMALLKTLTPETAMTELQIATKLELPKTTVTLDMDVLRKTNQVRCEGVGKIKRVYWI